MRWLRRLLRVVSLVLLAVLGTVLLMRMAPGYFTDAREMDAQYAGGAWASLREQHASESTILKSAMLPLRSWARGDLGRSRQYDVPVTELLRARAATTGRLLALGIFAGWLVASALATVLAARRTSSGEPLISLSTAVLLAVPVGALATFCLVSDFGGPVFVLAMLVAARDFKLLYRMLRQALRAPQMLYARAQGFSFARILRVHLWSTLRVEMMSLAMTSFVVALSALVPVEVVFDAHGLGQLAWAAAMNRDLPVLLAVTALLATAVGLAGMFADSGTNEDAQCA